MDSSSDNLQSVISIWQKSNYVEVNNPLQPGLVNDIIASIFNPGKHYYFILNFYDLQFKYVHPAVEEIVGCKPEDFNFDLLFEKMHPDDAVQIPRKESAATEFFYKMIPTEKIPFYKASYTFRLKDGQGGWKNILHQSIALQVDGNGRIHFVLCVHTDITYLSLMPDDRISFIGIHGDPSFYALSTDPKTFMQPRPDIVLSAREKEIVQLLADGLSSKQIAAKLFLSSHTVDTHRRNLLKKTGSKNTLELAVICLKRSLI